MKIVLLFLVFIVLGIFPLLSVAAVEVIGNLVDKHTGISGDTYTGTIKIYNSADTDQEVKVYASDYSFNYKGNSFYDEAGSNSRSNAYWIQFSPKFTVLKAKETQYIQYEVKIPMNDSLTGTYWSVLMIEGAKPINTDKKGQLNISSSTRFAFQVVTNIADTGIGDLHYMQPTVITEMDKTYLDVVLENTGERLISPLVTAEFFNEEGTSVRVLQAPKNGMYPTTSASFRFNLEGIETKKTYQVVIVADGGNDDVFGLELPLKL